MATIQKRNYTVELLRFIFCLLIINYHFSSRYLLWNTSAPNFFMKAYLGDEFFFMISGFFLAEAAMKAEKNASAFAVEQVVRRIKKMAIPFYIVWFLCFVGRHIADVLVYGEDGSLGLDFLNSIFELGFLKMVGFSKGYYSNEVAWFFSALLIVVFLISPFLAKYKNDFTQYMAPLITIAAYAILAKGFNYINEPDYYIFGFVKKGLIRALAGICGGVFLYGIVQSQPFQNLLESCSDAKRNWIRLLDISLWGGIVMYMVFPFEHIPANPKIQFDYIVSFLLLIALLPVLGNLAFSVKPRAEKTAKVLGKFSYYAFLAQSVFHASDALVYELPLPNWMKFLIMNLSVVVFTMLLWKADTTINNYRRGVKKGDLPT